MNLQTQIFTVPMIQGKEEVKRYTHGDGIVGVELTFFKTEFIL